MTPLSMRHRVALVGVGAAAVGTAALAGRLLRDVIPPADAWIVEHLTVAPGSPAAKVATAVSGIGTLIALAAVVAGAAAVWWHGRRTGKTGPLGRALLLLPAGLLVLLLQQMIMRPGPPLQPAEATFPSGHATVATAAVFAAAMLWGSVRRSFGRAAAIAGGVVVLAVSAGRVMLAEHWLLDVAGAIVATVGVGLLTAVLPRMGAPRHGSGAGGVLADLGPRR